METTTTHVTRWKRYGKDRLYVRLADDTAIGFWDLVTDEPHPASPEHLSTIVDVAHRWKAEQSTDAVPTEAPSERPWVDLATNTAGEQVREQAVSARDAAPVKTLLSRALGVHTEERAWRLGARGEELVARELAAVAKKDPRWLFLHAIPVGNRGSDIDHLIVGPGGVFTVNTKHHPKAKIWVGGDTFMVDGYRHPYVRNSRHEASRAATLLSAACGTPVHVEGLIVTVNAADVVVKKQPEGVHVVYRKQLASWLLRHGDCLGDEQVRSVYDVARRSTTWTAGLAR